MQNLLQGTSGQAGIYVQLQEPKLLGAFINDVQASGFQALAGFGWA